MKILMIAGHGAGDPGAVSTIKGVQYREATETRTMASLIAKELQGIAEVVIYPTDRNAYYDYQAGSLRTMAQFAQYDYVLEVHFNAFQSDTGDGKTKGVEVIVTPSESSTTVETAIAKRVAALGFTNRGVKRRGDLAVINTAKASGVPAALVEVCFIDDADDMKIYTADRAKAAQAITAGIKEGFGLCEEKKLTVAEAKQIIQAKTGLEDKSIEYLNSYIWRDALLVKLATAMK